jgi:hypothetical protein
VIELLFVVVLIGGIAALYVAADRARTIAICAFERGKVRVVQGRLAAGPLGEIEDVAQRMRLTRGNVKIRKQRDVAVIEVNGVTDPRAEQQLRNALGRFPLARMR